MFFICWIIKNNNIVLYQQCPVFLKIWKMWTGVWRHYCSYGIWEGDRKIGVKEAGKQPRGTFLCNPNWIEKPAFERCKNPHAATSEHLQSFINAETWEQTGTFFVHSDIHILAFSTRKAFIQKNKSMQMQLSIHASFMWNSVILIINAEPAKDWLFFCNCGHTRGI